MATSVRGPIRVADLSPELIDAVELIRDGETVTLRGYVSGRRCPGRIKAQAAAAIRDNPATGASGFDFGGYLAQIRELLCAVVVGIEDDEADMLAGDDGPAGGLAVLRLLGWWSAEATDDDEADADPEATALSSTTENSSPSSAPSTARMTG